MPTDTPPRPPRARPVRIAGVVLMASVIGLALCLIELHYVYRPWPWVAIIACIAAGLLAFVPSKGGWRLLGQVVAAILMVALVALSVFSGLHRFNDQANARTIAARQATARASAASSSASVNAAFQQKLDRAATEAANELYQQGFTNGNNDVPDVELKTLTSGTVSITIYASGFRTDSTLPIQKINGTWIAGCPTTDPGVMYPLNGQNNQVAISLNDSGHCPAGIQPPSESPATTPSRT